MEVILFSRYGPLGASSRLRSYQYLPYLKQKGINVTPVALFGDDYLKNVYAGKRPFCKVLLAYLNRCRQILKTRSFDLIWIEKELLPWMPEWFEVYFSNHRRPYIVDYDDAIFHKYDHNCHPLNQLLLGKKIDSIMKRARLVTVGNDYLARRAINAGAGWVEKIHTVIDLNRYPLKSPGAHSTFRIGWVGSPTTSGYLKLIEPALVIFCRKRPVKLILVGAGKHNLSSEIPIISLPWSERDEATLIGSFDVGIMPLPETPWARGKCGYKLIQYMACGRPFIASRISAELNLVKNGENGFLADSMDQWVDRLEMLYNNRIQIENMGKVGRRMVAERYSLDVTAPHLMSLILKAANCGYHCRDGV